jgi:hypothetical protein
MSAKTRVPCGLPAIPLRERKIILVCVLCLVMVIIESNEKNIKIFRLDLWIALARGSLSLAWSTHRAKLICPGAARRILKCIAFSDTQTYDEFSQSVLVGNGFGANEIPQRFYILFSLLYYTF